MRERMNEDKLFKVLSKYLCLSICENIDNEGVKPLIVPLKGYTIDKELIKKFFEELMNLIKSKWDCKRNNILSFRPL